MNNRFKKKYIVIILIFIIGILIGVLVGVKIHRQHKAKHVLEYNNKYEIALCIYGQAETNYKGVTFKDSYSVGPECYDKLMFINVWGPKTYDLTIIDDLATEYEMFIHTGEPGDLIDDYLKSYRMANINANKDLDMREITVIVYRIKEGYLHLDNGNKITTEDVEFDNEYIEILSEVKKEEPKYISSEYYAAYLFLMNHMDELCAR